MKMKIFPMLTLCAVLGMASCDKNEGGRNIPDADPIILKSEYKGKTESSRAFAIDLFKATVAESGGANVFISPYSVNMALGMLWNGAAGESDSELQLVLGNTSYTKAQINDYSKTLTDALIKVDKLTDLKIANSIWADNKTPFKSEFVKTNETWYDARSENIDFSKADARAAIDKWVRNATNNKIDRITDGMDDNTKFALVNAVYFKGKWRHKFNKSNTAKEKFTNRTGAESTVDMMNQKEKHLYADDDKDWKLLRLPYGNYAFSMVLMMPYGDEPLDEKIETLTAEKFYELFSSVDKYEVTLKLPKFKAEYSYDLHKKILPGMGLETIFDPAAADLSGMSDVPVAVGAVIHKTYIDVYEDGTEAAAVTTLPGYTTSPPPGTPVDFFADRPFIYSIVENSTGTILFMGRVNNF